MQDWVFHSELNFAKSSPSQLDDLDFIGAECCEILRAVGVDCGKSLSSGT